MEAKRKRTGPTATPALSVAAITIHSVLGVDDLLREILLRLGFPTCLVRAAAVSKRWLRHASDPAFLRRFRELHPPRLLGFYFNIRNGISDSDRLRFVPLPRPPPELASVVARHSSLLDLEENVRAVLDCRNGTLLFLVHPAPDDACCNITIRRLLHRGRGTTVLWRFPKVRLPDAMSHYSTHLLLHEDRSDGNLLRLLVMRDERRVCIHLTHFQAQVWGNALTSDTIEAPEELLQVRSIMHQMSSMLAYSYGKVYLLCMPTYILGLDLSSRTLFCVKLPDGVVFENRYGELVLSRADDGSAFYLVHVRGLQIRVWLHSMDSSSNNNGTWKLTDTICLRQVFGRVVDSSTWQSTGARVYSTAVGDNAVFVFLHTPDGIFYMDMCSRTVEKVWELNEQQHGVILGLCPLTMMWPPTFPALNDGQGSH